MKNKILQYFLLPIIFFAKSFIFSPHLMADLITPNDYPNGAPFIDMTNNYATPHLLFNDGFYIANGIATIATNLPIYGTIRFMSPNSTIELESDIVLAANNVLDLTAGFGYISGNHHSITISKNLTIPSNSQLIFLSDTAINGNKKGIIMGLNSQLVIDSNVTLTLNNVILYLSTSHPQNKPIFLHDGATLVLENSQIILNSDFQFEGGYLFIDGNSHIRGQQEFIYSSTYQCYIEPNSTLILGTGDDNEKEITDDTLYDTAFTYSPYTPDKELIILQDKSSRILMEGCTFQITFTGIRLTRGIFTFHDNNILKLLKTNVRTTSQTNYQQNVSFIPWSVQFSQKPAANNRADCITWSNDGKTAFVGYINPPFNANGDTGILFRMFTDHQVKQTGTIQFGSTGGNQYSGVHSGHFSPDDKFLAVVGYISGTTSVCGAIYKIENGAPIGGGPTTNIVYGSGGTQAYAIRWSPRIDKADRKMLAIGGDNRPQGAVDIHQIDANGSIISTNSILSYVNAWVRNVEWSPDGKYLAVAGSLGTYVYEIYEDGTPNNIPLTIIGSPTDSTNIVSWSKDGKYLIVSHINNYISIHRMQGGIAVPPTYTLPLSAGSWGGSAIWLTNSRYFICIENAASGGKLGHLYRFDPGTGITQLQQSFAYSGGIQEIAICPDNRVLGIVGDPTASEEIKLYSVYSEWPGNFHTTHQLSSIEQTTNTSVFDNAFIFGNSALGAAYNLTVNLNYGKILLAANLFIDNISP